MEISLKYQISADKVKLEVSNKDKYKAKDI